MNNKLFLEIWNIGNFYAIDLYIADAIPLLETNYENNINHICPTLEPNPNRFNQVFMDASTKLRDLFSATEARLAPQARTEKSCYKF